jgi:WD40 repeat protein
MQSGGDVVAYNEDGSLLALGYTNGQFIVLNSQLEAVTKRCDNDRAGKAITCIKFNGSIMAVGATDGEIIIYDTHSNFKQLKTLSGGHKKPITHMDFSSDGNNIVSNSQDYDIVFWDIHRGV